MKAMTGLAWAALLCAGACGRPAAGPPGLPPPPHAAPVAKKGAGSAAAANRAAANRAAANRAAANRAAANRAASNTAASAKTASTSAAKAVSGCGDYGPAERLGRISKRVREASGLVQSRRDPTVLWTHNDGAEGVLYGLALPKGKVVAKVTLSGVQAIATDWEELSDGPCGAGLAAATPSARCLIIGDIGDNRGDRAFVAFHRLREPDPRGGSQRVTRFETMRARYPKRSLNSEAFVMDDAGVIWLWTKADKSTRLFRARFVAGSAQLELVAKIKSAKAMGVASGRGARLTAAAWDPRAHRLLLRSYDAVWELCLGKSGLRAMPSAAWHRVPVTREKQGEAIAIGGGGFFHVSEGKRPYVYRVPRR